MNFNWIIIPNCDLSISSLGERLSDSDSITPVSSQISNPHFPSDTSPKSKSQL